MSEVAVLKFATSATECSGCARTLARDVKWCPYCGNSAPNVVPLRAAVPVTGLAKPFNFEGGAFSTLAELSAAFHANWDAATKVIERGYVLDWARGELHDFATAGFLDDLRENAALMPDERLFAVIARFGTEKKPYWKGKCVDPDGLLDLCKPESAVLQLPLEVLTLGLLGRFDEIADTSAYGLIEHEWASFVAEFREQWRALEDAGGPANCYPGDAWLAASAFRALHAHDFAARLAEDAKYCLQNGARDCPWYMQLTDSPVAALVASLVRDDAVRVGERVRTDGDYAVVVKANVALWSGRRSVLLYLSATSGLLVGAVMGFVRIAWSDEFSHIPQSWAVWRNTVAELFTVPLEYFLSLIGLVTLLGGLAAAIGGYYWQLRKALERR